MVSTLDKIQILEKYVSASKSTVNHVVTTTITKLIEREIKSMKDLLDRLKNQLQNFEKQYSMTSYEFHKMFEQGKLGDDIDYIEWSSTLDMFVGTQKRLEILTGK